MEQQKKSSTRPMPPKESMGTALCAPFSTMAGFSWVERRFSSAAREDGRGAIELQRERAGDTGFSPPVRGGYSYLLIYRIQKVAF